MIKTELKGPHRLANDYTKQNDIVNYCSFHFSFENSGIDV